MAHSTPDQALQEYIDKLGEERGRFVKAVENDLFRLRINFEIYEAFFGANKERIELFNSISGHSAHWIEQAMFSDLLLSVCRLTDPSNGRKKEERNVTVTTLPSLLTVGSDEELERRVGSAKEASKFARDWRNRRIAHADEQVRLGRAQLDTATRAKLGAAIEAIAACVRRYALTELNTTLGTHPIRQLGDDEMVFLEALYYGRQEQIRIESRRNELIARGEWDKLDELEALPDWLTSRKERKDDFE